MKPLRMTLFAVLLLGLDLVTGCNSSPSSDANQQTSSAATPTPSKPLVPYTGLQAFSRVSGLAQKWAVDAIPVRLESQVNSEANGQGGKATVWKATFISPSRGKLKYFYCSGSRLKESPPYGSSGDVEQAYSPDVPALEFQPLLLKTDSDKAYDVSQQHGGAALIKKNPDQVVTYFVLWNTKQHALYWYVMYGKEKESAVGTVLVNALTGAYAGTLGK